MSAHQMLVVLAVIGFAMGAILDNRAGWVGAVFFAIAHML